MRTFHSQGLPLLLSTACAGVLMFVLGRLSNEELPAQLAAARPAESGAARAADAPAAVLAPEPREARTDAPTARVGTARELLEAHYGLPWNALVPLLENAPDPEAQLKLEAWEELAPVVRAGLVRQQTDEEQRAYWRERALKWWNDAQPPTWNAGRLNPSGKPLAPIDVQNLERIATEYDSRLSDQAELVCELLPRCIGEHFDRGQYRRWPVTPQREERAPPRDSSIQTRTGISAGGWTVKFSFESADYPELEAAGQEIERLKLERFERCRDYIAGL